MLILNDIDENYQFHEKRRWFYRDIQFQLIFDTIQEKKFRRNKFKVYVGRHNQQLVKKHIISFSPNCLTYLM